jgi:phosphatidylinositol phospholipase C gamma-1
VNSHENADWYHKNLNRAQAEELMKRMRHDGSFLVRPSDHEENGFSITFRAEGIIKHCRIQREDKSFCVGRAKFDSLTELINWYEKNPLYRKVRLTYPVNEATLRRFGSDPDPSHCCNNSAAGENYMDSLSFNPLISVKALYDYTAARDDELSFPKHAIITNVMKQDEQWWRGDYGGKIKYWFPANFVQEITSTAAAGTNGSSSGENGTSSHDESGPLGNLQKGSIDIINCSVVAIPSTVHHKEHVFRIISPNQSGPIDIAAGSAEDQADWIAKIRETAASANEAIKKGKRIEKELKIAKEFSSLIVYCRAVPFDTDNFKCTSFTDMSSFPETKADKLISQSSVKFFTKYHKNQFTRVYPKGSRLDSSNFDPIKCWNAGVQMVALNYQTPDRSMQLNHARFRMNGSCGFVLRPEFMFKEDYDPYSKTRSTRPGMEGAIDSVQPIALTIRIIAARNLSKSGRGIVSTYVETEIAGVDFDCAKFMTKTIPDNGLNPVWNESFVFDIEYPDLAFVRFVVNEEDSFGDPNFLAQATYPVKCLRLGYRSVTLRNEFSDEQELASLLIHVDVRKVKGG